MVNQRFKCLKKEEKNTINRKETTKRAREHMRVFIFYFRLQMNFFRFWN